MRNGAAQDRGLGVIIVFVIAVLCLFRQHDDAGDIAYSATTIRDSGSLSSLSDSPTTSSRRVLRVIVVPGGGVEAESGRPHPWVIARLERAADIYFSLRHDNRNDDVRIVALSRGTTHKPPTIGEDGRPVVESTASMKYLAEHLHVPTTSLYEEAASFDTIGNAFFLRTLHFDPLESQAKSFQATIVTNTFHMPRTKRIFDWVMSLPPRSSKYNVKYVAVENRGMGGSVLRLRRAKEVDGVEKLIRGPISNVRTLPELHKFIFQGHDAYRAECRVGGCAQNAHALDPKVVAGY
eukprot:g1151.t1